MELTSLSMARRSRQASLAYSLPSLRRNTTQVRHEDHRGFTWRDLDYVRSVLSAMRTSLMCQLSSHVLRLGTATAGWRFLLLKLVLDYLQLFTLTFTTEDPWVFDSDSV